MDIMAYIRDTADVMNEDNEPILIALLGEISNALTNIHLELVKIREVMEK